MTYKAIVKNWVSRECEKFVESALIENRYGVEMTMCNDTELYKNDGDSENIYFKSTIEIYINDRRYSERVIVGGVVDDAYGVSCSVIWDRYRHEILWMSNESAREQLNIKAFNI